MKDSRKILVVVATFFEAEAIFNIDFSSRNTFENDLVINGVGVDVLITGVGPMAAFVLVDQFLSQNKYDLIINLGIAGTLTDEIALGDAVVVTDEKLAMPLFETDQRFETIEDLQLTPNSNFMKDGHLFLWSINDFMPKLKRCIGLTTGIVFDEVVKAQKINRNFNADIESMEGAAVLMACNRYRVKMIEIRTISNVAGDRNKENWEMKLATKRLNVVTNNLFEWLKKLS